MSRCEECDRLVAHTCFECPHCGGRLVDGTASTSTDGGDDGETQQRLSRRAMLGYSGGSLLVTLSAAAAGWGFFIYERTGPAEDVVREYVEALDRAHFVTAAELFHENAPDDPPTPAENPDLDSVDITVEETEILDRAEDVSLEGVRELALVGTQVAIESAFNQQTVEPSITTAKNTDGDWRIWEDQITDD